MLTSEETGSFTGNIALTYLIPILLANLIHKKNRTIVEEVFVIHEDGRLISYATLKVDDPQDEDIVSGLLTAVKDLLTVVFVKKEAKGDVGPYKFELGDRNIILRMGKEFYIAIVFKGKEDKALLDRFDSVMLDIQKRYGDVIDSWSGKMEDVEGVNEIIM
ncbi:MAG: hypothetical protein JSV09_01935 [Thermoplasmata archaeon]|nr:MAG: hypothetical protein JSV09_01935 [Thermoplasmata archaeon]